MFVCSPIRIPARRSVRRWRPAPGGRAIRPRRRPRWPPMPRRSSTLAQQAGSITELDAAISVCRACPRLVTWREEVAVVKRRAFADQPYWGRPVPGWGSERPRLLIVGLAPAAHGANRTGRMFTGDRSGRPAVRGAAPGRAGEPADQRRRRGRVAGQPDSDRRAGAVRASGQRPDAGRTGHLLALAGCRMAPGVRACPGDRGPGRVRAGRSRCGCRARPGRASRSSATASSPSCRPACGCSAATTRASRTCSPVG